MLKGIEPDGGQFSSVQLGSKWSCFQYSWYSRMVRNTAMDGRRHSEVTAQSWCAPVHATIGRTWRGAGAGTAGMDLRCVWIRSVVPSKMT